MDEISASRELGVRSLQESLRWLENLPFVTFYGGSQIMPGTPLYEEFYEVGFACGKAGIPGTTGGGPGGMEALNKGLQEGGSLSFGLGMPFKHEGDIADTGNPYLDLYLPHANFKSRKSAFHRGRMKICFAGGLGTCDEFFEEAVQCQRNFCHCLFKHEGEHAPILLVDTSGLWRRIYDCIADSDSSRPSMLSLGLVDRDHLDLFQLIENTPTKKASQIAAEMIIDYWQQFQLPIYHTTPRSGTALALAELQRLVQNANVSAAAVEAVTAR